MGVAKVPPPRPSTTRSRAPNYSEASSLTPPRDRRPSFLTSACLHVLIARVSIPCSPASSYGSPASSPSTVGVHANSPPRWEWRRCLPTTTYSRARLRAPKSPRSSHQRPPETGVRHSLRRSPAPLAGGRPHWMSPPGCQGWEWRRCLATTI